jgi:hypothetical protein
MSVPRSRRPTRCRAHLHSRYKLNGYGRGRILALSLLPIVLLTSCGGAPPDVVTLRAQEKIGDGVGGFEVELVDHVTFGRAVAGVGDLDGDGVPDLAVGAFKDSDGGVDRGAVYLLYLNSDGTVREHRKLSSTEGGFVGPLQDGDRFGTSVVSLGDVDGSGVAALAVGAALHDGRGTRRGSVWILFMNPDGTVRASQKLAEGEGGFTGELNDGAVFGISLAAVGDVDGDGVADLVVGVRRDDGGGEHTGSVWVLFINRDGTVREHTRIGAADLHALPPGTEFGQSVGALGDLDGDGVPDVAVGAFRDVDGGSDRGAVWILFLHRDGTVKAHQKISSTEGGFRGPLRDGDLFGSGLALMGDLRGDGTTALAVGARRDNDGGTDRGAVWLLFLNPDGTVVTHQKISERSGAFRGALRDDDQFCYSLGTIGDLDGSGLPELAASAIFDNGRGENRGAVWILFLDPLSLEGPAERGNPRR